MGDHYSNAEKARILLVSGTYPYYYFYKERKPWRGDHTTVLIEASFLPVFPAVSYTLRF